jgi:hypothetical protein
MLDRRPRIIINGEGILDRSNRQGLIPWEMIKEAYDINIANQAFISLVLDDKFIFKEKQYNWAKKLIPSANRIGLPPLRYGHPNTPARSLPKSFK